MRTGGVGAERMAGWRHAARNRWVRIAGIAMVLIVLTMAIAPFFINADAFRPAIENELSSTLGRSVTIGHLSYSFFSGGLVARNVAVADDPRFGSAPFFQVKSMRIGVDAGALLLHRALHIRSFVADSPEIRLISGPNGTWNYSTLGSRGASSAATASSGAMPSFVVGVFQIRHGSVLVSHASQAGATPFLCSDVNVTVRNLSWTRAMPFDLSARLPGDGSLTLEGAAGPIDRRDASATPLQARLTVTHFDPAIAGILPAGEGISMVADVNAQLTSDGQTLTSSGQLQAAHLLLSRSGSPAPQPLKMTYELSDDLPIESGQVRDLTIQMGPAAAYVTGSFQTGGSSMQLNLHLAAPNLPIDQFEQLLPAVGIRLPKGSRLKGGLLNASLMITGTASAPVISGPVEVDNTQLVGFDLASRIAGLKALRGMGNATEIRALRAVVKSTAPETQLTNIYADLPALGTATGNGTVSAAGALDFHLTAKLGSAGGVGTVVNGAAKTLSGLTGSLLNRTESNGVPITVTGTSSDPVIRANLLGMFAGQQRQRKKSGLLKGLLGG